MNVDSIHKEFCKEEYTGSYEDWLEQTVVGMRLTESALRKRLVLDADTKFKVTLVEADERTGYKAGTSLYPKGVYFHRGNCIVVGSKPSDHVTRLKFKPGTVRVEIIR